MDKDTSTDADSVTDSGAQLGSAGLQPPAPVSPASAPTQETGGLQERVVDVLKTCFDPEIPVNIYELGLIYSIQVDPPGVVGVRMTLTSPMCPVAGSLPPEVEAKIRGIAGVSDANVEVVWEPPWSPAMMSDAAKLQLNLF
jgi:FeS assembly SUF system protein